MRAFTHGTVIDTITGSELPDYTVLVNRGLIATVGPTSQVDIPEQATVVDATGKYLIPGLADMHIHSDEDDRIDPPLQVVSGVTLVREMWGKAYHHDWRRRVDDGTLLGPQWVIGSKLIDGVPSLWSDIPGGHEADLITIRNVEEVRRAVGQAQDSGADFLKVYSRVPAELYPVLLDEAARRDIPVMGHRPDRVQLTDVIERGQRSLEHVHALWPAMSRNAESLEQAMAEIAPKPGDGVLYTDWFQQLNEVEWNAANTYSPYAAKDIFERMVANDVAYTPTLVMHRLLDNPASARMQDDRMRYVASETRDFWPVVLDMIYTRGRTADEGAKRLLLFEWRLHAVAAMAAAGVRILAGTDLGTGFLYPGFALHEELELFARAGLSPLRALQTATIEPARFLGKDHERGSIRPDNVADLVILNANPLDDIRNTQRIHSVMVRGRYLGPDDRRRILDEVAAAAAE